MHVHVYSIAILIALMIADRILSGMQVDKAKCIIASVYNIQAHQLVLQGTEGGPGTVELFCQCSIVDIQGNYLHS